MWWKTHHRECAALDFSSEYCHWHPVHYYANARAVSGEQNERPPTVEAKRNTTGLKGTTRSKKNLRGRYHTKERGDELKHMSKSFTRINIENCNLAVTNWYSSWVSCFPIPWKPFWTPEVSRFQKGTYGWSKMQLFCNLATASCPWGNSECLLCWHHNLW